MIPTDKICMKCINSKRVKNSEGNIAYPCQLGYDIYMGCQVAGSIDKFEPKKKDKVERTDKLIKDITELVR
jgi:hypothetical protein